jgi:rubrerythrin
MRGGAFASLKWVKPKARARALTVDEQVLATTPVGRALLGAIAEFGLPEPKAKEDKKTPQAEAAELLRAAAEVEQALLTEYLYAAYSLTPGPAAPAAALRRTIVQIAVEEMGHLITVQNLLLALGEDPYFDRENVPLGGKPAGQYPFPLAFEPLSGDALAKYVTTESVSPESIDDAQLRAKLQAIQDRADQAAGRTVNHVGVLYAKLFWLFQPDDQPHLFWQQVAAAGMPTARHIPDKALKGLADPRQVTPERFDRSPVTISNPSADDVYVIEIRTRADALFALSLIAAQGESYKMGADSHFNKFLAAYDQYGAGFPAGAVRPFPKNPHTVEKVLKDAAAEAGRITQPKALRWAKLFNLRYQLLLLEMWLGVNTGPAVTGPLAAAALFGTALNEMLARVRGIGDRILPKLPLKDGGDSATEPAAAPFELPIKALPATEKAVKQRMADLLTGSADLAADLQQLLAPNQPTAAETNALDAMQQDDADLRQALAGG